MFPPAGADDWVLGDNPDAIMTIIEYSDFMCPYCSQLAPVLKELQEKHPDDIRIVFRHYPLPSHNLSIQAAQASEAAGMQGKFWEMHDAIFAAQGNWAGMTAEQFQTWLEEQAKGMDLDQSKFIEDMNSAAVVKKVADNQKHALDIGIPYTPFMLMNGKMYPDNLPRDITSLESFLKMFQVQENQYTYCPPMRVDPKKQYIATLKTEKGDVVVQLFPDKAPMAVNSFVFLAREGWFDDITFHRVIPNFVAQTGDPSGTGFTGPGYYFEDEITDLKFDKAGMLGMANSGPGTNGSQFFITYAPATNLDGKYTVFGQVIEGMENVEKLTPRNPDEGFNLPAGDTIISVEIEEK
jgi:cyclophilin family peptidyl-prolyl cis-trans isomerase